MDFSPNLKTLTDRCGEWLRGSGPESDIVISSRIRLARNLANFPFIRRFSSLLICLYFTIAEPFDRSGQFGTDILLGRL